MILRSLALVSAAAATFTACESPAGHAANPYQSESSALDDSDPDDPSNEPPPAPPHPAYPSALEEAMKTKNFTPSDPSTWSAGKKAEICDLYANVLVRTYDTVLAYEPAHEACLTGKEVDLGMFPYQTLQMRRGGFMPTEPAKWTDQKRGEVCDIAEDLYRHAMMANYLGSLATAYGKAVNLWCDSFGEMGLWSLDDRLPSKWEYAQWEYRWWNHHGVIDFGGTGGEPPVEQDPIEPPR